MLEKLHDYKLMGTPTIVVIYPQNDLIFQYKKGARQPVSFDVMELEGSACLIDWAAIRATLD